MTISELIERLEKATGPDRWLDAHIDAAFRIGTDKMRIEGGGYDWAWKNFPEWGNHTQAAGMCGLKNSDRTLSMIWDSRRFTSSIDEAVKFAQLMLPGWFFEHIGNDAIGTDGDISAIGWTVEISPGMSKGHQAQAKTFPLAICLSVLLALKAIEDAKGDAA